MKTHLRVVMLFLLATVAIYAQAPEKMDAGFAVLVKQWTNALLFFKALVQVNRRRP